MLELTLHYSNTQNGAVCSYPAAFKPVRTKLTRRQIPLCQQMAPVLHVSISDPVPGKGRSGAIYRVLERSKLFLKNASTLLSKNTLAKRGRVNKDISRANPPPRSMGVMTHSRCTGQTMIFSFSPFIFPSERFSPEYEEKKLIYLFIYLGLFDPPD